MFKDRKGAQRNSYEGDHCVPEARIAHGLCGGHGRGEDATEGGQDEITEGAVLVDGVCILP